MLTRTSKKKLISKHRTHDGDTGSPHVQVAILTAEIEMLSEHLKEHRKDESARRGLLGKVARRRKILNRLKIHEPEIYEEIVTANSLKK